MTRGPQMKALTLLAEEEPRDVIFLGLVSLRLSLELKTETIKNLKVKEQRLVWPRCALRDGEYVRRTPHGDLQDPQGRERMPRNRGGDGGTFLASPTPWAQQGGEEGGGVTRQRSCPRGRPRARVPGVAPRQPAAGGTCRAVPSAGSGLDSCARSGDKSPGRAKTRGRADGGS